MLYVNILEKKYLPMLDVNFYPGIIIQTHILGKVWRGSIPLAKYFKKCLVRNLRFIIQQFELTLNNICD